MPEQPTRELQALARALPALRVECPFASYEGDALIPDDEPVCPACHGLGYTPNADLEVLLDALNPELTVRLENGLDWWFAWATRREVDATTHRRSDESPALALQRAACHALGLTVGKEE